MKEILNICGNHTYLTNIEVKIDLDFGELILCLMPKLTLNHSSPIDQEKEKNCDG
jgi:hypothetical protein